MIFVSQQLHEHCIYLLSSIVIFGTRVYMRPLALITNHLLYYQ